MAATAHTQGVDTRSQHRQVGSPQHSLAQHASISPFVQGPTNPLRSAWQRPMEWAPSSATISWSLNPILLFDKGGGGAGHADG